MILTYENTGFTLDQQFDIFRTFCDLCLKIPVNDILKDISNKTLSQLTVAEFNLIMDFYAQLGIKWTFNKSGVNK